MQLLSLSICVFRYPIDTFRALQSARSRFSIVPALALMLTLVVVRVLYIFIVHYPLSNVDPLEATLLIETLYYVVPIISWAVANFASTSILDGEVKMGESITATVYALMPLIIFQVPLAVLSRILSLEDIALFYILTYAIWAWVIILVVISVKVMNNYTMFKTIVVVFVNIFAVALMWAVALLFYALASQLFVFIAGIYKELRFTLGG